MVYVSEKLSIAVCNFAALHTGTYTVTHRTHSSQASHASVVPVTNGFCFHRNYACLYTEVHAHPSLAGVQSDLRLKTTMAVVVRVSPAEGLALSHCDTHHITTRGVAPLNPSALQHRCHSCPRSLLCHGGPPATALLL